MEYLSKLTAPAGANELKIKKIQGRGLVWNQLNNKTFRGYGSKVNFEFLNDVYKITILDIPTSNTRSYEISMVSTSQFTKFANHKYVFNYKIKPSRDSYAYGGGSWASVNIPIKANVWTSIFYKSVVTSINSNISLYVTLTSPITSGIEEGDTYEVKDYMIFDLTEMFGFGNEPSLEEFEAMLNGNYFAYNIGTNYYPQLTGVKVKNKIYNIPYESSDLLGVYADGSYQDYEECKQYLKYSYKPVGLYRWTKNSYDDYDEFLSTTSEIVSPETTEKANFLSSLYPTTARAEQTVNTVSVENGNVIVRTEKDAFADASAFYKYWKTGSATFEYTPETVKDLRYTLPKIKVKGGDTLTLLSYPPEQGGSFYPPVGLEYEWIYGGAETYDNLKMAILNDSYDYE